MLGLVDKYFGYFYGTRIQSLATLVTNWLTQQYLVDMIDVTLACEDAKSKIVTAADVDDRVSNSLLQGCISCGILQSGIRARGVSSEHMENMEMFSCSPT